MLPFFKNTFGKSSTLSRPQFPPTVRMLVISEVTEFRKMADDMGRDDSRHSTYTSLPEETSN